MTRGDPEPDDSRAEHVARWAPAANLCPIYVFRWGKYLAELKGQRCQVEGRGALNSARVRWLDEPARSTRGWDVVSRHALCRLKPPAPDPR